MALYKLWAQAVAGPRWDTFSFLANAAAVAGRGYGYTEPARPPLMSVIAAPLLAAGFTSPFAIQLVDFAFGMLLLAGVFFLVRKRMGSLPAVGAALAVLLSPPVWEWLAVGYTDIGAVALCVWALLAVTRATEEDPRYYMLAFALIVCACLMRTTSLLFAFPFGVWMLLRTRAIRHAGYLVLGMVAALAVYLPFGIYYTVTIGDALYPFATSLRIKEAASGAATVTRQVGSYLTGLPFLAAPSPIAWLTILVLFVSVAGIGFAVFRSLRERHVSAGRIVAAALLIIGATYLVTRSGLMASQVVIAGAVYLTWRLLASDEHKVEGGFARIVPADLALDAAVVAWLLSYYGFHEAWAQRVTRYYITMAPQVAYLVALAWWQLYRAIPEPDPAATRESLLGGLRDPFPWIRRWFALPIVALILVGFVFDVLSTNLSPDPNNVDARNTGNYLAKQPDAGDAVVYSDMWPLTAWYMRRSVKAMPTFDYRGAFGHELDKTRAEYYAATGAPGAPPPVPAGFKTAFSTGNSRVFKRVAPPPSRPEVQYLGAGWENYLERLVGQRIYLQHSEGDYDLEGSRFFDAFTLEELSAFPVVAAFGGMWENRADAERLLMSYVEQGGTLVLDASGNLSEPYRLDGSILFDTVIMRKRVPDDAVITLDPAFASRHPELGTIEPTPWTSESGDPWYGASYDRLPGSTPLTVLAYLGDKPVVAERRWGKGRVIWIAFNLPFHAKLTENESEARLISAILSEAASQTVPVE